MSKYFKFRKEEVPQVAGFIQESFKRDMIKFENFSPDFNPEFLERFNHQINSVRELVNPLTLIAEQKKITSRLYENMDEVRHVMERIQAYAHRSNKELNMKHTEFGCKEARSDARRRHMEGVLRWIRVVEQNIANNREVLQARGMKDKYFTKLKELREQIESDHQLRSEKQKEREELVADNMKEFDILWKIIHDISRTGRLLFKDEVKIREYMFTHLLKRVRVEKDNIIDKKSKARQLKSHKESVSI